MARVALEPGTYGEPWFEQWWRAGYAPAVAAVAKTKTTRALPEAEAGAKRRIRAGEKPGRAQSFFVARVRVRSARGRMSELQRQGDGKASARRGLTQALEKWKATNGGGGDTIRGDWTIEKLAEHWLTYRRQTGLLRAKGDLGTSSLAQMEAAVRTGVLGDRKVREDGEWVLRRHSDGIAQLRIAETTGDRLQTWLSDLEEYRCTEQIRAVLSQMFDLAVRRGALVVNPMSLVAPSRRDPHEVKALTLTRAQHLRTIVDPDFRRIPGRRKPSPDLSEIVDFTLGTAARIGEVLAVRWMDLELDGPKPTVDIRGTLLEPRPPQVPLLIRQAWTKGKTPRRLVLPDFVVEMLRRRYDRITAKRGTPPPPSETVFATAKGTLRQPANLRTTLRIAVAGIPDLTGTTPHTLRRTVATLLAHEINSDVAGAQLGHKGALDAPATITNRRYVASRGCAPDSRDILDLLFQPWPGEEDGDGLADVAASPAS